MAATIASKLSAAAALGATTAVPQRRRAGQQHAQRVPPTDLTCINQRLLWLRAAACISLTPPAAALMTQLNVDEHVAINDFKTHNGPFALSDEPVPSNHAFVHHASGLSANKILRRLKQEYELLNQLPSNISVISFQDRMDLFRCLIFGPRESIYDGFCLMVDLMLPETYPFEPPLAEFHRFYANASYQISSNIKINPNLNANSV